MSGLNTSSERIAPLELPSEALQISAITQGIFDDPRLYTTDGIVPTKGIHDPANTEQRLIISDTDGHYPLSYIENQSTDTQIISLLGYFPLAGERNIVEKKIKKGSVSLSTNKKVIKDPKQIKAFLKQMQEKINERSGENEERKGVLTSLLQENSTAENHKEIIKPKQPVTFSKLLEVTDGIEAKPLDISIDVQQHINEQDPRLLACNMNEEEIKAMQLAANMLFKEVTLPNKENIQLMLPVLQKLLKIFEEDRMRSDMIGAFMAVLVPRIDEYVEQINKK